MHTYHREEERGVSENRATVLSPSLSSNRFLRVMASRGMTAIEAMVWVSVTSMLLLAIVQSVQYFYRTNTYAVEQGAAITSGQRGVEEMIKMMREAAFSSTGAWPIISMATSSFAFYADIDSDPFIEQIRFYIDGNSLKRGIVDPSGDPPVYTNPEQVSVISDYVRNNEQSVILFKYYNAQGALMTDLSRIAEVRFVEVTVVVNINPHRLPNQFTLRSTAALRNLK